VFGRLYDQGGRFRFTTTQPDRFSPCPTSMPGAENRVWRCVVTERGPIPAHLQTGKEPTPMKPRLSLSAIKLHFENIYAELHGRLRTYSKRFADRFEALAEMTASSWINLLQKAQRTGELLCAGALAWVAWKRYLSGRRIVGEGMKDVLSPQCFRSGRVRVFTLSEIATPRDKHGEFDEVGNSIAAALTTKERDRPDNRAAVRIDWRAFADRLPYRERRLLRMLSVGFTKGQAAKRLKLSGGRISQILDTIGDELRAFFGDDIASAVA
jgi:hypothetical protein